MARESGLVIIPVVSKIDSPLARIDDVVKEVSQLLGCPESDVVKVSGKTGEGVDHLLNEVVRRVPPPTVPSTTELADTRFRSPFLIFSIQTIRVSLCIFA